MLYVVSAAPPAVLDPSDLATLSGAADLIELRLDLLPDDVPIAAWIEAAPRPVLATVRSHAEGGLFRGSPQAAAARLHEAATCGAAWLDVERRVAPHLGALPARVRLLASTHGAKTDASWARRDPRFERVKIARPCNDAEAFDRVCAEARGADARTFLVPYGRLAATRTLFAHAGAMLFGAPSEEAPAAPGQPTLDVLLGEMRVGEITPKASLFGLVGQPPARSPSPAIHNAAFRAAGRDALYLPLEDVPLGEAVGLPVEGLSVTVPDKGHAYAYADSYDDDAAATGVLNTLVRSARGWHGGNTDVGAIRACAGHAPIDGARGAYVYGAGGFARAAVRALKGRGWDVRVGARKERSALALAEVFGVALARSPYERMPGDALIVNATPAGADGRAVPAFEATDLAGLHVLDAPYARPGRITGLVQQARTQGASGVTDGRALLRAQAEAQARLFAGTDARALPPGASPEHDAVLVLVGTRAAGKTSVGAAVARTLGRPFVDLDADVERITGRSPAAWVEAAGWPAFRAAEHDALVRALARPGLVLATGGGTVELEANRVLLADTPLVVHLELSASESARRMRLDPLARPRLPGADNPETEAEVAVASRAEHWRAVRKHVVDAHAAPDVVARAVLACWLAHHGS